MYLINLIDNMSGLTKILAIATLIAIAFIVRFIFSFIEKKIKSLFRKSESNLIKFPVKRYCPKSFYLFDKSKKASLKKILFSNLDIKTKIACFFYNQSKFNEFCKDITFLGVNSKNKSCYITKHERSTHFQVIGRTGSGKSASVLRNMIYQDIKNNHGVIIVDAKGSGDFRKEVIGMAVEANRTDDVFTLNLGEPSQSDTYSPFYLSNGVDPQTVADRFFTAAFNNKKDSSGDYYLKQQASILRLMVSCLAGQGKQFKAEDIYNWLLDPDWGINIRNKTSAYKYYDQFHRIRTNLGRDFNNTISGLVERVQVFANNDKLNTNNPDIKFCDIFEKGQILYCQFPTGVNSQLAPDLARVIFQEIEYETSLREIGAYRNKDKFISVYADEFYEWTYEGIVGAIGKARSGNVSWLVAHQSKSDLERISKPFWQGVWDNTANKIILEQTDPDLGDFVAKSIGTETVIKETWRSSRDLGIDLDQGEQSNREAEVLKFNPNNLKNLARVGQGFLIQGRKFTELNFGLLDPPIGDKTYN